MVMANSSMANTTMATSSMANTASSPTKPAPPQRISMKLIREVHAAALREAVARAEVGQFQRWRCACGSDAFPPLHDEDGLRCAAPRRTRYHHHPPPPCF
mmetsp:Transcript_49717/g.140749  ORF Transcript_49717/g.140749 Transcript_49717/m.140749 type:complete len:100 (+) Transcript_49717:185-484(+)